MKSGYAVQGLIRLFLLAWFTSSVEAAYRYESVKGSVPSAPPYSFVKITAFPLNGVSGCESTQYLLTDRTGHYAASVPVFMGENLIRIDCNGRVELRFVTCRANPLPFRVRMSWIGNFKQDGSFRITVGD